MAEEVIKKQMLVIQDGGETFDATIDTKALAFPSPERSRSSSVARDLLIDGIRRNVKLEEISVEPPAMMIEFSAWWKIVAALLHRRVVFRGPVEEQEGRRNGEGLKLGLEARQHHPQDREEDQEAEEPRPDRRYHHPPASLPSAP